MSEERGKLAEQLRQEIQSRLHSGLEARAELVPNGEAIQVEVVVPIDADGREPWSRHVLVADLERGDAAIADMAKLLAERASREWLAREAEGVEN